MLEALHRICAQLAAVDALATFPQLARATASRLRSRPQHAQLTCVASFMSCGRLMRW